MFRRNSTIRRFELVRAYFAPTVGLLLWLGVCVVAWISLSNFGPERLSKNQSQTAVAPSRPQHGERTSSRRPPAAKGDYNDRDMTKQAGTRKPELPEIRGSTTPKPDTPLPVSPPEQPAARPTPGKNDTRSQHGAVTAKSNAAPDAATDPPSKDPDEPPASATPASPIASPHVLRAQLTSGIEHREPIDRITGVFHTEHKQLRHLYYFTEFKGLSGETVTHNWWHEGRLVAQVSFHIGGYSWRVYSIKKLIPSMTGPWRVVVTDSQGKTLSTARFVYEAP